MKYEIEILLNTLITDLLKIHNVVIADSHPIVRLGFENLFSKNNKYCVVGEVKSLLELTGVLREKQANILILELSIPGGSGLEAVKEVKSNFPDIHILTYSIHPEIQFGLRAFKSGASGYLSKESAPEKILEALSAILTGKRYFGKVTEDSIFLDLNRSKSSSITSLCHNSLSDRELHVFLKIGEGQTLTQISKDLSLSIKTVSTYRIRALKKMMHKNNSQVVLYCSKNGLLPSQCVEILSE